LDSLPITTDQKVGGSSPSEPALFSQVIALRALDLVTLAFVRDIASARKGGKTRTPQPDSAAVP